MNDRQLQIGRAQAREVRESSEARSNFPAGWSKWVLAMTPNSEPEGDVSTPRLQAEGIGFRMADKQALREKFDMRYRDRRCGIYEWKIEKPPAAGGRGQTISYVVYIGCTCRKRQDASIIDRVWEYCVRGAHKKENIKDALRKEYRLYVRIKESSDLNTAQDDENNILKFYDYAWNVRGVERRLE